MLILFLTQENIEEEVEEEEVDVSVLEPEIVQINKVHLAKIRLIFFRFFSLFVRRGKSLFKESHILMQVLSLSVSRKCYSLQIAYLYF